MNTFNMNYFEQPVPFGQVKFMINNAEIKDIPSANGPLTVIAMDITLTDLSSNVADDLDYLMFTDRSRKSIFSQFVQEYISKIDSAGFSQGAQLIGISGQVKYYCNKKGYDTLSNWEFNIPNSVVQSLLNSHVQQNAAINPPFHPKIEELNNLNHNAFDNFTASLHTDANVPENTVNDFDFEYERDNMEDNGYV
ncbi:hypothetical protein [Macrococcoides caseolyticum]|uniref:hypothetical protein n=1 Tax=Macrococcoides caseolyticum TaxID=69966 RepID=UPI000C31FA3A|nr:hypothetical protein [Macrococcus caseolyticus]PKE62294.1 hypothetical protein CW683_11205 [Macrococcus caseolyticus]